MNSSDTNLFNFRVPFVLRKCLNWKIANWSIDDWKEVFSNYDSKYPIKVGSSLCSVKPQWERNTETVEMTVTEFLDEFAANEIKQCDYWYYFDYKHIAEYFADIADKMDVSWELFGYPKRDAKDSTLWMGTTGAHTPCHFDTYGCNLVAQLYGRKRWILISPDESSNMKPTRVPYEESSVYSKINFFCACSDFSGLQEIRCVELEPGDVLYVPRHWWHYVENLSPAISINTWIPLAEDGKSRLEESLVKIFISSMCKCLNSADVSTILNPNEDDLVCVEESRLLEELNWCINSVDSTTGTFPCNINVTPQNLIPTISSKELSNILKEKCKNAVNLKELTATEYPSVNRSDIINAFCQPDVITLVRQKLDSLLVRNKNK